MKWNWMFQSVPQLSILWNIHSSWTQLNLSSTVIIVMQSIVLKDVLLNKRAIFFRGGLALGCCLRCRMTCVIIKTNYAFNKTFFGLYYFKWGPQTLQQEFTSIPNCCIKDYTRLKGVNFSMFHLFFLNHDHHIIRMLIQIKVY